MTNKSALASDEALDLMARNGGFWPPSRRIGDGERYLLAVLEERGLVYRVRALTRGWGYTDAAQPRRRANKILRSANDWPGKGNEKMTKKNWTVSALAAATGAVFFALGPAVAAHADQAAPPPPAPSEAPPQAPSEAPPPADAPLWTGDYDDGDIYIIPIL
jgi:hypothetical protein